MNRVRNQAPPFGAFAVTSERGRSDPADNRWPAGWRLRPFTAAVGPPGGRLYSGSLCQRNSVLDETATALAASSMLRYVSSAAMAASIFRRTWFRALTFGTTFIVKFLNGP